MLIYLIAEHVLCSNVEKNDMNGTYDDECRSKEEVCFKLPE